MKIFKTGTSEFEKAFKKIRNRGKIADPQIGQSVKKIVSDVIRRGDKALFYYTRKFDGHAPTAQTIEVSTKEKTQALKASREGNIKLLETAAARIKLFHKKQVPKSWEISGGDGIRLGQKISPLEKVGIYCPGGLAAYPSTVLMTAIPARVAGVREIIMTTPCFQGAINPLVIAAAEIAGVDRIFKIGGAQAIAALAYGTESVPPVDKIVGPGNAYVATAKTTHFRSNGNRHDCRTE